MDYRVEDRKPCCSDFTPLRSVEVFGDNTCLFLSTNLSLFCRQEGGWGATRFAVSKKASRALLAKPALTVRHPFASATKLIAPSMHVCPPLFMLSRARTPTPNYVCYRRSVSTAVQEVPAIPEREAEDRFGHRRHHQGGPPGERLQPYVGVAYLVTLLARRALWWCLVCGACTGGSGRGGGELNAACLVTLCVTWRAVPTGVPDANTV